MPRAPKELKKVTSPNNDSNALIILGGSGEKIFFSEEELSVEALSARWLLPRTNDRPPKKSILLYRSNFQAEHYSFVRQ